MTLGHVITRQLAARMGLVEPVPTATLCPCPRCGSADIWPELAEGQDWSLYCRACQWTGPQVAADADVDTAVSAWNREGRLIREARVLGLALNLVQDPLPAEARA